MVVAPVVLESCYLVLWPKVSFTPTSDYAAFTVSVLIGLACLIYVLRGAWQRVIGGAIYIPLAVVFLYLYVVFFSCVVFGECL